MNKTKKVLITGASTGIGYACLKIFVSKGWHVSAHFYEENLEFSDFYENNKNSIDKYCVDFSNEVEVKGFIDVISHHNFNALINSAGCFDFSKKSKSRISSVKDIFCINTIVPTLIAETVFKNMCQNKSGNIINISSIGVKYGSGPDNLFYGASKAAIEPITRTLARDGAPNNILVNTIRPGITDTDFYKKTGKDIKDRVKLIPLARAAEPDEMANAIYYFASENTYITGQIIPISGGE
tara:strand:+ start:329 stop:1045 length:717 start_codon:yes stop_codon:yes gene_type:complete